MTSPEFKQTRCKCVQTVFCATQQYTITSTQPMQYLIRVQYAVLLI